MKERDSLEDLCMDGPIMLKWFSKEIGMGRHDLDSGIGYRQGMGLFEHGTEPLVSKDVGNLLTSQGTISLSRRTLLYGVSGVMPC